MLLMYLLVVLRHPIDSRIQDVAALLAINGAWALAESWQRGGVRMANGVTQSLVRRVVPLARPSPSSQPVSSTRGSSLTCRIG
jgi:hypothetical protein